jgi:hypothetical protein
MRPETPKKEGRGGVSVNAVPQLAPDEPLSPELVLVLPAEVRAQVLAALGPPVWPTPRPPARPAPPPVAQLVAKPVAPPVARSMGTLVVARFAQLALIFVVVAIVTLAMSLVAQAFR